jgi:hypothetical protein
MQGVTIQIVREDKVIAVWASSLGVPQLVGDLITLDSDEGDGEGDWVVVSRRWRGSHQVDLAVRPAVSRR